MHPHLMTVRIAFALSLLLVAPGLAFAVDAPKNNYVNFHAQALSVTPSSRVLGLAVEWGAFQNRYVATGTRVGFSHTTFGDTDGIGMLEFGGGPQFHVPIGEHVLVIPAINLGYRLSTSYAGLGIDLAAAVAYRFESFYLGAEFQAPLWMQGAPSFFPGPNTLNALVGFYF